MSFRITGLSAEPFRHLYGLSDQQLATFRRKNDAPLRGDFSGRTGICCTIVPDLMT